MKKLIFLLATVMMVGCASSPSRDKESTTSDSSGAHEVVEVAPPAVEEREESRPAPAPVPMAPTDAERLSQAVRAQNWSQLESLAQMILAKNPRDVKALNAMGLASYRQGKPKAALYFFNRAMRTANPTEKGQLQNNIGLVHLQFKESREALKTFKSAAQSSRDPFSAANLGSLYLKEGDPSKALIAFEMMGSRFNQDIKILNNQGAAFAGVGKYDQALQKYQEALKINPGQKEVLFNLAILYVDHLKKPAEGREALQRLKFHGVSNELRESMNELEKRVKSLK